LASAPAAFELRETKPLILGLLMSSASRFFIINRL